MYRRSKNLLFISVCVLLQAACGGQAVYKGESFSNDSPFRMRTDGEATLACESARRVLLGQGYLIDSASGEAVRGRKAYKNEDAQNAYIEMNVVCLPEIGGSTLYANGLLSAYELKKSASSASVGVSALGSISLPIGQSADSLVKVSEETINDGEFYRRFFAAIRIVIREMQPTWQSPAPPPERAPELPATQPPQTGTPLASVPPPVQEAPPAAGPQQVTAPILAVPTSVEQAPLGSPETLLEPVAPALAEPPPGQDAETVAPAPQAVAEPSTAEPGGVPEQKDAAAPELLPGQDAAALAPVAVPVGEAPAVVVPEPAVAGKPAPDPLQDEPATVPESPSDPQVDLF